MIRDIPHAVFAENNIEDVKKNPNSNYESKTPKIWHLLFKNSKSIFEYLDRRKHSVTKKFWDNINRQPFVEFTQKNDSRGEY